MSTASLWERWGVDWIVKLRTLLQVVAFSLAIAALQVAYSPERPYLPTMAYSVCIGFFMWAIIDLGRHPLSGDAESQWPQGWVGVALVGVGIVAGFVLGNLLADLGCRTFGWYEGAAPVDRAADLRRSMLIAALAGVVGSFYFYATGKSQVLERKVAETRRHADEARLRLLESQLEPHMLFNTLANLRVLIGTDPTRATAMLDRIIAYLRATLAASRTPHHALQAEFDRLRDYLELMTVRMGPRLRYTLDVPAELASHPVPALLLQPLVENSIRHGLEPKAEGGHIRIQAQREGSHIVLHVEDDGQGLHAPSETTGTRFGLAQVRERLAAEYGPSASLTLQSAEGGGTRVTLSFPDLS